ncbi:nucleoside hydrolase [Roseomonas xinghualingensis]|uniref:nucleoside hydrolase n=1 Tax=Roseomonas xinghualingensis TaxID=2986475 RepID=UPI0021F23D80|nr:nucleoside hydrolase [Roseomonas sp. SXEYE001]MCV4208657.1 nucleoside hydrolase [Roseomonas sp. SXEYE001]
MSGARRPVILDCDPGTDDALALWLALASPEIDLRMVTVVGGNVGLERTVANAASVVGLSRAVVPVVPGAGRPLRGHFAGEVRVHGDDGLRGVTLPPGPPPVAAVAADAIRAMLHTMPPAGMTLVGIGPATNLALALATEPELAGKLREIVLMGGAWGEGNWTPAAEFNAASDPEALDILLALGVPLTLLTLELTSQALVRPERVAAMRGLGDGACLRAACDIMDAVLPSRRLGGKGHPLHDACAIAWLIAPELFETRLVSVQVDCGHGPARGRTHVDRWGRSGAAATVTLPDTLDTEAFFALLGRRLARLP